MQLRGIIDDVIPGGKAPRWRVDKTVFPKGDSLEILVGQHFVVPVELIAGGVENLEVQASCDLFKFENMVKPDYSNAGGLEVWSDDCDGEGNAGWESWYDEETGEDDPEAFLLAKLNYGV